MSTTPEAFLANLTKYGVSIDTLDAGGGFIRLSKRFQAGDTNAYAGAETDVGIIYDVPTTQPGSTWGTDGGSVGGMSAVLHGCMVLNRTGCSKRFLAKLAKLRA